MSRRAEPPISTGPHTLLLLPGMPRVIASIRRDVAAAARRVMIETYIYHDRKFGRSFARYLERAAARGADVRLLYDALGSHLASAAFFEELRAKGVASRSYRPPEVVGVQAAPFPRDHGRVVVVDDAAYTGGAAWADQWLPRYLGGDGWYDVCLRVAGPVVEDFARLFERRWREADGTLPPADFTTGDTYPDLELVGDSPEDGAPLVLDRYREAVRRAKKRVWIENAYFFPPEDLERDLHAAVARGVDVELILPGNSDLAILDRAARDRYESWIRHGIRVFEYQATMLHSKFAVVDDDWCTVGSFNVNPTSIAWANEVALFVLHPAFVRRVAEQFEADRALSRPVAGDGSAAPLTLVERAANRLSAGALRLLDRLTDRLPG